MDILYEDNHLIVVNKAPGEIVQGDKTGDEPMVETLRKWIKEKYSKPGNVFCGVVHRLDRPVGGVVIFAKTSKALSRLNEMLRNGDIHKTYWALTRNLPPANSGTLRGYIKSIEKSNKSLYSNSPKEGYKEAILNYRVLGSLDNYHLIEVNLITGRKHQIRVQLSSIGCPIKGDLKYGDKRSNPDGSISLLAHKIEFVHPVSKKLISIEAHVPKDALWEAASKVVEKIDL